MIKKLFFSMLLFPSAVLLFAQTQTGYVRMVGRPDNNAGERLSGVQIKVSGLHGSVVSKEQGDFDFDLQGGKDSYQLTSVVLDNYELNEKEIIGRTFGVTKVPQEIVMVSLAEKNRIRREVEEQVEARYKVKYDDLQRKLASKEIEAEDYRRQLQELESIYDKREQLVSDMVERYSHTDYAVLTPIEKQINAFIEQGELEKADSVINTLNISKLEADRKVLIEDINKKESQLAQEKASKASIDSTLLIAYRGKVDIFKAEFEKDSTALYYEKMIAIDSTDIRLLLECGNFISDYLADYNKAITVYQSALRQSLAKYGKHNSYVATSYNNIAFVHYRQGDYVKALELHQKALNIRLQLYGERHPNVAISYNDIGLVYDSQGDYAKALDFHQKALDIRLQIYGERHPGVATSYNNIGSIYYSLGDYSKALELLQKSFDIRIQIYGERHPDVANSYNNIGSIHASLGDYSKALELHQKALDIQTRIYGECHPKVATSYSNMGIVYYRKGDYSKALELHQKALDIRLQIYGDCHPEVADSYNQIGKVYDSQDDYAKALELYQKALNIRLQIYGKRHPDVATSYNNIGGVYNNLGEYAKALELHQKSLDIKLQIYGESHPAVATSYNNIGGVYDNQGDYSKALEFYQKALNIWLQIYGERHPDVAASYNNMGAIYSSQGDYVKALELYQKALDIWSQLYGERHPDVAISYNNIGLVYYNLGDYAKALELHQKALNIWIQIYGESHPEVANSYNQIGKVYDSQDDYAKALDFHQKALEIWSQIYGMNRLDVAYVRMGICSMLIEHYPEKAEEYLKDKLYIMTLSEDSPAAQRGYSGKIYLLEFGEWNIECNEDILRYSKALKGKAKTLVFMQDGKIYKEIFEDSIGGIFGLKQVTAEERQSVINQYREWKQRNADK